MNSAEALLAQNRSKIITIAMDMTEIENHPDRVKIKCQAMLIVLSSLNINILKLS